MNDFPKPQDDFKVPRNVFDMPRHDFEPRRDTGSDESREDHGEPRPPRPQRPKPKSEATGCCIACLGCGGFAVLLLVVGCVAIYYTVLHGGKPLEVNADTTHIVEPLKEDGKTVDYFRDFTERINKPVPREENGFVLLCETFGEVILKKDDAFPHANHADHGNHANHANHADRVPEWMWPALCKELELDPAAEPRLVYTDPRSALAPKDVQPLEIREFDGDTSSEAFRKAIIERAQAVHDSTWFFNPPWDDDAEEKEGEKKNENDADKTDDKAEPAPQEGVKSETESSDEKQSGDAAEEAEPQTPAVPMRIRIAWDEERMNKLKEWTASQNDALDAVHRVMDFPKFRTIFVRENEGTPLLQVVPNTASFFGKIADGLYVRGLYRLKTGDTTGAWKDAQVLLRLDWTFRGNPAYRSGQWGQSLFQMVLYRGKPTKELLRTMLDDLNDEKRFPVFDKERKHLIEWGRYTMLDAVSLASHHPESLARAIPWIEKPTTPQETQIASMIRILPIDWNVVARKINEYADVFVPAAEESDPAKRYELDVAAFRRAETMCNRDWEKEIGKLIVVSSRSEFCGDMLGNYLALRYLFYIAKFYNAAEANDIFRLRIALEAYKLEHGTYPKELAALVPAILPRVPTDRLNDDKPFTYTLKPDGSGYRIDTNRLPEYPFNLIASTLMPVDIQPFPMHATVPLEDADELDEEDFEDGDGEEKDDAI